MPNILPFPAHYSRMAQTRIKARQTGRKLAQWRAEVIAAWDAGEIDAPRAASLLCAVNRQISRWYGLSGGDAR
jgi:hypothetical protein